MADWPSILADENVDVAVVEGLRRRGFDIVAVHELRRKGYGDEVHMAWALDDGRVILTHDDDYLVLDGAGSEHCRILFCHQDKYRVGGLIEAVIRQLDGWAFGPNRRVIFV